MLKVLSICLAGVGLVLAQGGVVPDPLVMADGTRVKTAAQWREKQRPELLQLLTREMYGVMPPRSAQMKFVVFEKSGDAFGGLAIRRQVTVLLKGEEDGPKFDLLLYIPKAAKGRVPAILGMNFYGNQAVTMDPEVRATVYRTGTPTDKNQARGANAGQWPIEDMLRRGYAVATFARNGIDPDTKGGFDASLKSFYPELQKRGDNFSTIGEWAWCFSRAMDYLVTDRSIDAKRVAIFGWSRLGKAALWAGATDERVAAVISNESGAGGAKLFHRGVGETVERLNTVFPHWFDENFRKYNGKDTELPFDQNEVIALIAPRAVYVGSAEQDATADPEGEFASAKSAGAVYRLLGKKGLPVEEWPAVNHPVSGDVGYHVRSGGHDVKPYDWEQYLPFLDRELRRQ